MEGGVSVLQILRFPIAVSLKRKYNCIDKSKEEVTGER